MFNLTWGFGSAFVNTFITGVVIPNSAALGPDKVGYFVALIPLTAAALSLPLAAATKWLGSKAPAMMLGSLAFLGFYLAFATAAAGDDGCGGLAGNRSAYEQCGDDALTHTFGSWAALVPLLLLFGTGRAVWEGINKSVFADAFPHCPAAAFANVELQSGGATALAFFLFPLLRPLPQVLICAVCAVLSIAGYFMAGRLPEKGARPREAAVVRSV